VIGFAIGQISSSAKRTGSAKGTGATPPATVRARALSPRA